MTQSSFQRAINVFSIVLCGLAVTICNQLVNQHITGDTGPAWFEAGCPATESGKGCEKVLKSRFSYVPPRPADTARKTEKPVGVPTAFLGMLYYATLATWLIGIGTPSYRRRYLHLAPATLVACGLAASAFYIYIMATTIGEWCTWCLVTHLINGLLGFSIFLLRPLRPAPSDVGIPGKTAQNERSHDELGGPLQPSFRSTVVTLFAMLVVTYGALNHLGFKNTLEGAKRINRNYGRCIDALKTLQNDPESMVSHWESTARTDFAQPGGVVRQPNVVDSPWTVVIFSDFACPQCKRTAARLENEIQPLFAHQLRIVFRHYPLHRSCNGSTRSTMHPHACEAARLAEAVRLLEGDAGFWRAHDLLFENQARLKAGKVDAAFLASGLSLDTDAVLGALTDDAVEARIKADTALGGAIHIRETPSVFLEGRLLHTLANQTMTFWDAMADRYWASRGEPRPAETRLRNDKKGS